MVAVADCVGEIVRVTVLDNVAADVALADAPDDSVAVIDGDIDGEGCTT